eukprot:TRINITY_DN12337_c0_g1_i2.p1 TRINITY_DN12337_c0_g1~~TRINITY_DN12337_c0_g1_i2.p1  ORF type:complete len:403 (+),score=63.27 TRINITY_DN12337_c0_g1_i2:168-1376(+)
MGASIPNACNGVDAINGSGETDMDVFLLEAISIADDDESNGLDVPGVPNTQAMSIADDESNGLDLPGVPHTQEIAGREMTEEGGSIAETLQEAPSPLSTDAPVPREHGNEGSAAVVGRPPAVESVVAVSAGVAALAGESTAHSAMPPESPRRRGSDSGDNTSKQALVPSAVATPVVVGLLEKRRTLGPHSGGRRNHDADRPSTPPRRRSSGQGRALLEVEKENAGRRSPANKERRPSGSPGPKTSKLPPIRRPKTHPGDGAAPEDESVSPGSRASSPSPMQPSCWRTQTRGAAEGKGPCGDPTAQRLFAEVDRPKEKRPRSRGRSPSPSVETGARTRSHSRGVVGGHDASKKNAGAAPRPDSAQSKRGGGGAGTGRTISAGRSSLKQLSQVMGSITARPCVK